MSYQIKLDWCYSFYTQVRPLLRALINKKVPWRRMHTYKNRCAQLVLHVSASYPGRQAAQCVSLPVRGPADSPAGSSLTPQSRIGPGSTPDWCYCCHAPPHSPSSNWGIDKDKKYRMGLPVPTCGPGTWYKMATQSHK